MSVGGSRRPQRWGAARSLNRALGRVFRSLRRYLAVWRIPHRTPAQPETVVIGTLRRPRLAIAMQAIVVRSETAPPPLPVFLERLVADPLGPYCPRCSLPLEPWRGAAEMGGQPIGYECRPCGTRTRWTPADVLNQMKREVRRHYARYWTQYREAIRQRERGAPRAGAGKPRGRGGVR